MTPCLLPSRAQLVGLRVCGTRYWPLELGARDPEAGPTPAEERMLDELFRSQVIHVKKRSGALSYEEDPTGVRSMVVGSNRASVLGGLFRPGQGAQQQQGMEEEDVESLCRLFTRDPALIGLAQVAKGLKHGGCAVAVDRTSHVSSHLKSPLVLCP